jgi:hypothetical protein
MITPVQLGNTQQNNSLIASMFGSASNAIANATNNFVQAGRFQMQDRRAMEQAFLREREFQTQFDQRKAENIDKNFQLERDRLEQMFRDRRNFGRSVDVDNRNYDRTVKVQDRDYDLKKTVTGSQIKENEAQIKANAMLGQESSDPLSSVNTNLVDALYPKEDTRFDLNTSIRPIDSGFTSPLVNVPQTNDYNTLAGSDAAVKKRIDAEYVSPDFDIDFALNFGSLEKYLEALKTDTRVADNISPEERISYYRKAHALAKDGKRPKFYPKGYKPGDEGQSGEAKPSADFDYGVFPE